MTHYPRLSQALAVVRLGFFCALFCYLGLLIGLELRSLCADSAGLAQPQPPANLPATQIPFLGINVALEQYSAADRHATLVRLKQNGFGWVRQRLDWGQLEPQAGMFNWSTSDAILQAISQADLIPVVLLDGSPVWARAALDVGEYDNPLAPPADPQTFAHFAAAFAQRYRDQVRFYQIWDEPNVAPHWGNHHIEPIDYARLLKAAATAIRHADGDAVILTAALAPTADRGHTAIDEVYFLQRLYAAGAAPHFDAVAVQPFGFGHSAIDARAQINILNFQRIKLVRQTMLAAGDGATPIWGVRYGWNTRLDSHWGTVTSADQALFAVQALAIAHSQWPWLATLGWAIDQPARPSGDPVWGFALAPALAVEIRDWGLEIGDIRHQSPISNPQSLILLLISAIILCLWRSYAALYCLPWRAWGRRYRAWPDAVQIICWGVLLIIYLFATWPPLILLCWLVAAVLITARPQVGIGLAAVTIPFFFQHKEIVLVDSVWAVAPAHALLLCFLPALLVRFYNIPQNSARWSSVWAQVHAFSPGNWLPGKHKMHGYDRLALLWLVISVMSSINVWQWSAYREALFALVLMPLLFYLIVRIYVVTTLQHKQLCYALFAGGFLVATSGLYGWLRGQGTEVDGLLRLVGPYYSPNHTALYLERTLFLGLGLAMITSGSRRRWVVGAVGMVALALLLTASRGAWLLGVPAGLGVLVWMRRGRLNLRSFYNPNNKALLLILALLMVGGGIGVWLFWERLTNSTTVSERLLIWQTTWRLWQAHPWWGGGPGGFFWSYPAYLTRFTPEPNLHHPHNGWLEFAAGWGVAGILWLCSLFWTGLRTAYQTSRSEQGDKIWLKAALLAALAAGFAHAQVDTFAMLADLALWNWGVLALWASEHNNRIPQT